MTAPPWLSGLAHPGGLALSPSMAPPSPMSAGPARKGTGVVLIHGSNAHRHWWRFLAPYLPRKYVAAWTFRATGTRTAAIVTAAKPLPERSLPFAGGLASKPFVIGIALGGLWPCKRPTILASNCGVIFNDFTVRPRSSYVEWGLRARREGRTGLVPCAPTGTSTRPSSASAGAGTPAPRSRRASFPRRGRAESRGGRLDLEIRSALFDHLEMGADQVDRFAHLACPSAVILGEPRRTTAPAAAFLSAATEGLPSSRSRICTTT